MSTAGPRIGRPPALTRAQVADAVIAIGFVDLTFAAVRQRLEVGQTTLFRHVADRDELVRIGLTRLVEQAPWPSRDGGWRDVLTQHALALWQLLAAHPGSAAEMARGVVPLSLMQLTDDLCAVLLRQGFTPAHAILACDIVFDMVIDNRRGVEHLQSLDPSQAQEGSHCFEDVYPNQAESPDTPPATEAERETIHSVIAAATSSDPLDWFTGKLTVALAGIEAELFTDR